MNTLKTPKEDLANLIEEKCPHTGNILNRYTKGRRLGKVHHHFTQGGFAVCHELINLKTNRKLAVKIIDKTTLTKSKAKEKVLL